MQLSWAQTRNLATGSMPSLVVPHTVFILFNRGRFFFDSEHVGLGDVIQPGRQAQLKFTDQGSVFLMYIFGGNGDEMNLPLSDGSGLHRKVVGSTMEIGVAVSRDGQHWSRCCNVTYSTCTFIISIHTYIHTYSRTYIHTYIHTYIYTCIHTYQNTSVRKCIVTSQSYLTMAYLLAVRIHGLRGRRRLRQHVRWVAQCAGGT